MGGRKTATAARDPTANSADRIAARILAQAGRPVNVLANTRQGYSVFQDGEAIEDALLH